MRRGSYGILSPQAGQRIVIYNAIALGKRLRYDRRGLAKTESAEEVQKKE